MTPRQQSITKPYVYHMGHNVFAYAMASFLFFTLYLLKTKSHYDANLTIIGSTGDCHHWQVRVVIIMTALTCQWMCLYMPLHNFFMTYRIIISLSFSVARIFNIPCGLSFSGGDHLGCTTPEIANIGQDWLGIISWVNSLCGKKSKSCCGQYYYDW